MEQEEQLKSIAQKIKSCKKCPLYKKATLPVPGEGNVAAEILFIGEAPGYWEDQKGRPFVGAAGKLLDNSLAEIGLSRKDVFITNVLKHRPPANRDPLPTEIDACQEWLNAQIKIINPKIIITLGRFSINKFLPGAFISQVHGQPRWVEFEAKKYLVLPFYHPAAALRNGNILRQFKKDFEKLLQLRDNVNEENNTLESNKAQDQKDNTQLSLL